VDVMATDYSNDPLYIELMAELKSLTEARGPLSDVSKLRPVDVQWLLTEIERLMQEFISPPRAPKT
jgi:hypothetical protein